MGGGLLQLSAYGSENEYINGNPQMTFLKQSEDIQTFLYNQLR